jgi:hypothetical protein
MPSDTAQDVPRPLGVQSRVKRLAQCGTRLGQIDRREDLDRVGVHPSLDCVLMEGVTSLQIAYWQPPGVWVSSWQQPDLPLLIRLRMRLQGDRRWPDIVAAPLLSRP